MKPHFLKERNDEEEGGDHVEGRGEVGYGDWPDPGYRGEFNTKVVGPCQGYGRSVTGNRKSRTRGKRKVYQLCTIAAARTRLGKRERKENTISRGGCVSR